MTFREKSVVFWIVFVAWFAGAFGTLVLGAVTHQAYLVVASQLTCVPFLLFVALWFVWSSR